jgi:uncharacterized Ntn-hydrolase superfamily protein
MTYSIVARDPVTGELGVAVQSHWFGVGSVVPSVRPGVGAVATQSVPDPSHGPRILDLLEQGAAPDAAIDAVLDGDEGADYRQIGVVDAQGRVATHTGTGCMADAGHRAGDGWTVQANIMVSAEVWPAMAEAYVSGTGTLAVRMLDALDAAEAVGGDVRGRQSAALVVGGVADLRVEDHPEPLQELRRLTVLRRAYTAAETADEAMAEGRMDEAAMLYEEAGRLAPQIAELAFWAGLSAFQRGEQANGLERVRAAIAKSPGLGVLLARLGPDVAPAADEVRAAL